ncbi:MAG: glycosyltransferase family 4 protein [Myxococcales bacterium]|nr:glycosyltransferase family 4 protein [Myxococcales bacterium]
MRVGLLTTSFPRSRVDSAGLFVRGFAEMLAAGGHRVEVLAPEPPQAPDETLADSLSVTWVPYMRPRSLARTFYRDGTPENLRTDPLAWCGVPPFLFNMARRAAHRAREWDALVAHWSLPNALLVGRHAFSGPRVTVFHSGDVAVLERLPLKTRVAAEIASRSDRLWFVSQDLADRFLRWVEPSDRSSVVSRTVVEPMGVTAPAAAPQDTSSRQPHSRGPMTILTLSRLVPIKGIDVLIRAMAGQSEMDLIVAGEGSEGPHLARLAEDLRVPVRFVGAVHGAAKERCFAQADLFASPSRSLPSGRTEGTPTAVLEAMIRGIPVVASKTGGLPEYLEHGVHAALVEPDRPDAWARTLRALSESHTYRKSLAAQGQARAGRFTWDAIGARRIPDLFRQELT